MSITFACPQCGRGFQVDARMAGRKARCRGCGVFLKVPRATGRTVQVYATPVEPEAAPEPPAPRRPRLRLRRSKFEPLTAPDAPGLDDLGADDTDGAPLLTPRGRDEPAEPGRVGRWVMGFGGAGVVVAALVLAGWLIGGGPVGPEPPAEPPEVAAAENSEAVERAEPPTPAGASVANPGFEPPPPPKGWPAMPPRGEGRELEPGITLYTVSLGPGRDREGLPPGHGLTLWFYLPDGDHPGRSLPCVLIAPDGGGLLTGAALDESGTDRADHLAWARAGFAVLAYSLDGVLNRPDNPSPDELRVASAAFLAARAGLTDAQTALVWLSAQAPEVDANRVYAAGRGAAATLALLLAERDARVKAVAALAPRWDVPDARRVAAKPVAPWLDELTTVYGPRSHPERLEAPVFLFAARDDPEAPFSETQGFADDLRRRARHATLAEAPSGGHTAAVTRAGLPRAIAWLKGVDKGR